MKVIKIVLAVLAIIIIIGVIIVTWISRPINEEQARQKISNLIINEVEKNDTVTQALVLVESGEKNFKTSFSFDQDNSHQIDVNQPFHVASIGKAFTATLIGMLIDDNLLSFDDPIVNYVNADLIGDLFVYEGVDFKEDVTISHLLTHTSGAADYFEDPAVGSSSIADLVLSDPKHLWTPNELIGFTEKYQMAQGKPGENYHYSDTGFILLGLIIERVSGHTFHEELHQKIFDPLGMQDSYLAFYSAPENKEQDIAHIWFKGIEISSYNSLSIDWAGGGIISTLDDLAIYIRALNSYSLVSENVLNQMYDFNNQFEQGIYYGSGFMEFHFSEYFPTLSFLPELKGHMGVLGTQMLYDKETDTVYICSFGSTDYTVGSVKTMIQILSLIYRIKE